jgi:hypothetical protein
MLKGLSWRTYDSAECDSTNAGARHALTKAAGIAYRLGAQYSGNGHLGPIWRLGSHTKDSCRIDGQGLAGFTEIRRCSAPDPAPDIVNTIPN